MTVVAQGQGLHWIKLLMTLAGMLMMRRDQTRSDLQL